MGVGTYNSDTDEIVEKAYYQWVPFVLFLQGLLFYAPHMLFKVWEGGKLKNIIAGIFCQQTLSKLKNNIAGIYLINNYLAKSELQLCSR